MIPLLLMPAQCYIPQFVTRFIGRMHAKRQLVLSNGTEYDSTWIRTLLEEYQFYERRIWAITDKRLVHTRSYAAELVQLWYSLENKSLLNGDDELTKQKNYTIETECAVNKKERRRIQSELAHIRVKIIHQEHFAEQTAARWRSKCCSRIYLYLTGAIPVLPKSYGTEDFSSRFVSNGWSLYIEKNKVLDADIDRILHS